MSYKVLARSQRPQDFSSVIGQKSTITTLQHSLNNNRLHHAYLFTGTRGVGKTTIARILAKCFNCQQKITSTPCGKCDHCLEISNGRFIDLIEVDAASRTKVEETRELLENINYAPNKGRFKVYLIDEIHMLSKHSFNALLKTIEEPPAHIKFLFATTDPEKIPATILSRCLQFHLRPVNQNTIYQHLKQILEAQKIPSNEDAILTIAKAAEGSVRDSLSLLDQAIAHGNGEIKTAEVESMLGITGTQQAASLLQSIQLQDANKLLETSATLADQGADFSKVLDQILCELHQAAISCAISAATQEKPNHNNQLNIAKSKLPEFSPQQIQLLYQSALIGRRDLELAPCQRVGFEMVLLRMLAFQIHQVDPKQKISNKSNMHTHIPPENKKNIKHAQPNTNLNNNASQQHIKPESNSAATIKVDLNSWSASLVDSLELNGAARALALQCSFSSYLAPNLCLELNPKHKTLLQQNYLQRIEQALQKCTKLTIKLDIKISAAREYKSPQQQNQQQTLNKQQAELSQAKKDPKLQKLLNAFDASIMDENLHLKS